MLAIFYNVFTAFVIESFLHFYTSEEEQDDDDDDAAGPKTARSPAPPKDEEAGVGGEKSTERKRRATVAKGEELGFPRRMSADEPDVVDLDRLVAEINAKFPDYSLHVSEEIRMEAVYRTMFAEELQKVLDEDARREAEEEAAEEALAVIDRGGGRGRDGGGARVAGTVFDSGRRTPGPRGQRRWLGSTRRRRRRDRASVMADRESAAAAAASSRQRRRRAVAAALAARRRRPDARGRTDRWTTPTRTRAR